MELSALLSTCIESREFFPRLSHSKCRFLGTYVLFCPDKENHQTLGGIMYDIIRQLIGYNGQINVDTYYVQCCVALVPVFVVYFVWCFTKLFSYVINFGRK